MTKILLPILIIAVVLIGSYFGYRQINKTPEEKPIQTIIATSAPSPINQEVKTFQSKSMQFSIQIPINFRAEEKFTTVSLRSTEGKILISRNSTNFSNLEDYLKNLSEESKVKVMNPKNISLNGLTAKSAFLDTEKTYFIFVTNRVYSISTSSQSLYPALDQIAQSFRYTQ